MKFTRKAILVALLSLTLTGCDVNPGRGGNTGESFTITIDGGGDISNFNSTPSMTVSSANPYPYNTLETLCKEWEKTHPGITVKVNKTSNGGDRATLLAQLKTKTSADIIYQNGTVVNEDLGEGYYLDLTDYLDKADPYLPGNAKWKTVYNAGELATTQAADGHYYYVNLEKIPVAFMYNKTLLNKAGISNPEQIDTFNELLTAMNTLKEFYKTDTSKYANYGVYSTEYTWYQLAMESNLFPDLVASGDVLRKNNMIDTEEMCRLYEKGEFELMKGVSPADDTAFESNRYYQYIKLIAQLDQYKEPATFAARQNFLLGDLGFIEVTGALLRTFSAAIDALEGDEKFEWGTICFPDLTTENSPYATKGVVRGSAGLASSWWVSNAAIEGGKAKTDACVDLLMYLTAPAQNNKLIGDLKGGIPLNPSDDYQLAPYLTPLIETYNHDIAEANQGKRVYWGSFNTWNIFGTSYNTAFIRGMQEIDTYLLGQATTESSSPKSIAKSLCQSLKTTIQAYEIMQEYDQTAW